MRKLLAATTVFVLVIACAWAHNANASQLVHCRTNWHCHIKQYRYHSPHLKYIAADDENCYDEAGFNMQQFMTDHSANVFRYLIPMEYNDGDGAEQGGISCVQAARSEGYKIQLEIQFNYSDTPQAVAARVAKVLGEYGPAWAVTIGGEENITPAQYEADWNVAEPVLAKLDPTAIRVGGDAYPWQIGWSEQVLQTQPKGLQAWAIHCYHMSSQSPGDWPTQGLVGIPALAAYAANYSTPVMCSEMAPAQAGWDAFQDESVASYQNAVQAVVNASPNLEEVSYYVWPTIGAGTYGQVAAPSN
jgi:hypothetical protein